MSHKHRHRSYTISRHTKTKSRNHPKDFPAWAIALINKYGIMEGVHEDEVSLAFRRLAPVFRHCKTKDGFGECGSRAEVEALFALARFRAIAREVATGLIACAVINCQLKFKVCSYCGYSPHYTKGDESRRVAWSPRPLCAQMCETCDATDIHNSGGACCEHHGAQYGEEGWHEPFVVQTYGVPDGRHRRLWNVKALLDEADSDDDVFVPGGDDEEEL